MNENQEMTLLDLIEKNPIANPLCVIKDGKAVDMVWEDLFDSTNYDELTCVTYVSSPSFFAKATKGFKKIQVIIGIEKADVKAALGESISNTIFGEGKKFFENLPDSYKQGVVNDAIELRYSKANTIIHSKFYLLRNTNNDKKRVIVGSANLTESAMGNNIHHYEDIMIFDDDEGLFVEYYNRFLELKKSTVDYVPTEVKESYKEGVLINMADFTPEEKTEELIKTLLDNNIIPLCDEKSIDLIQQGITANKKKDEQVELSLKLITDSSKRSKNKNGKLEVKPRNDLVKSVRKFVDLLYKTNKNGLAFERPCMTFSDPDRHQYWVYPNASGNERKPDLIDRQATNEEIKESINQIVRFVDAYRLFTQNPDSTNTNLAHIYEIILYAFMSSYIFKMRADDSANRADYPVLLAIGGRPESGKSNLLVYIDKLLSGRNIDYHKCFIQHKDVDKKDYFESLFMTYNTYPILVDEVSNKFFTSGSRNKGEQLIKYLSNSLEDKHPVMICTTNTSEFSIPRQVERRIYYIQVDDCFADKYKEESKAYYESILGETSNLLFRDFCFRMSERIASGEPLMINRGDFLAVARIVFKEYFDIAEIPVPSYFPTTIFNDYEMRGANMWKTLITRNPAIFRRGKKTDDGKNVFTIKADELAREREKYIHYLGKGLLKEEAGMYIEIFADPFLEWIGFKDFLSKWRVLRTIQRQ